MNKAPGMVPGVSVQLGGELVIPTTTPQNQQESSSETLDDIRTFLPGIGDEEHALRAKLRALRNTANAMISNTESDTARQLAWIVVDCATPALYAPGTPVAFADLNKFCTRLMLTAMQAENMDLFGAGQ
jgi:hypothetical protein